MDNSLLQTPSNASPLVALTLSQRAPGYIKSHSSWSLPYPLSLFMNTESQEKWQIYENMFLSCLRTGDHETASLYLKELIDRFGKQNDRIMALQGLYQESTAKNAKELEDVLEHYQAILKGDPTVFAIQKRRAALLRSMGKTVEAITALTSLLDASPTDAEAWSELGDVYLTQGSYDRAIFCFEEVLLITPNAWNMHARLGEVILLAAGKTENGLEQSKIFSESIRRFCRSIELCDDYLRGYYGLKLATSRLLEALPSAQKSQQASPNPGGSEAALSIESVTKLNEAATAKLAEIVRKGSAGEKGWDGFSSSELAAARQLLDRDVQKIQR